jgi:hypothetical protein
MFLRHQKLEFSSRIAKRNKTKINQRRPWVRFPPSAQCVSTLYTLILFLCDLRKKITKNVRSEKNLIDRLKNLKILTRFMTAYNDYRNTSRTKIKLISEGSQEQKYKKFSIFKHFYFLKGSMRSSLTWWISFMAMPSSLHTSLRHVFSINEFQTWSKKSRKKYARHFIKRLLLVSMSTYFLPVCRYTLVVRHFAPNQKLLMKLSLI